MVRLVPEGEEVLVTGDAVGPARFDLRELAEGLVACGERYLEMRRQLAGAPADVLAILDRVAARARAALASGTPRR